MGGSNVFCFVFLFKSRPRYIWRHYGAKLTNRLTYYIIAISSTCLNFIKNGFKSDFLRTTWSFAWARCCMQDPTDSDTMQITCKSVPISVGYEHNSCANRSSPSLTRECLMILPETSVEGSLNGHFSLTHSSIQVKSVLCYKRGLILDMTFPPWHYTIGSICLIYMNNGLQVTYNIILRNIICSIR